MLEKLYKKIFPILNFVPPELAHNLAIKFFSNFKKKIKPDDPILNVKVCNLKFTNPIGLAAGFDKNGEAFDGLMRLGFGFVEQLLTDWDLIILELKRFYKELRNMILKMDLDY